ncbi:MAG TPA: BatD family protein, partial [Moheibacter sp.]|nr:BatD family protein [Moheibacter sp.]
ELVNGYTYVSQELARYILYPQKTGTLIIDPFELGVVVSSYYGSEVVPLTSEPISLKVKSLPGGKPENFSGAIGNYKLTASLSKNKIESNKAVNLEIEIIGSGNLNTLKTPSVEIPENIETYAPKRKDAFEARPSGLKGKVVEEYLLVPQYGGEYQIGPIVFNYFDPNKEKYISLKTKPMKLSVDGPEAPNPVEKDSVARKNLNDHQRSDSLSQSTIVLPEKINKVKNQVVETVSENNNWVWFLLSGLILITVFFIFNLLRKKKTNTGQNNEIVFKNLIQNKLKELKNISNSGNQTAFYSLQEDILTLTGMHFSQTNLSEFRENEVAEKLEKTYSATLASRWKSIFLENKQAKYARFENQKDLSSLYDETKILVEQFFKF